MLLEREQYYIDTLNPQYNIAKVAGSTLGVLQSETTKQSISKALKGKYVGEKALYMGELIVLKQKN